MGAADLPVIILAFANEQEGHRYLRDLPQELRSLGAVLGGAEDRGLCRLVVLSNATLDDLFAAVTKHRDRLVVFHFGGHADSGRLLLEADGRGRAGEGSEPQSGSGATASAVGLARFLGQCPALQLVFLNGCSTRAQAAGLLDVGIAAVIATARAIDDSAAREFASAFYTELAAGQPLAAAYDAARARLLTARGDAPGQYYRDLVGPAAGAGGIDPADDHGFPWDFRVGRDLIRQWNLPDAAGNPLLGLPALPMRDLPESPFRHLAWFAEEHAEVFFGRGYQIRELYEAILDRTGSPILLLYGASGVGKSSVLDAGLLPRLRAGGLEVRYARRDPAAGLLGTLSAAAATAGGDRPLGEAWRAEEARLGRPLVVLLDQVEEAYTRAGTAQPKEVEELVAALASAFRVREQRPLGKLVLGFRKEWYAEIDRRLSEAGLDRSRQFLKPLERRGVAEAVRGPAREERLRKRYRIQVEDGLPERIADDLVADAGSALAPTLQVLLSKMWEEVKDQDPPVFDRALYETLKARGYLLKDVLDNGLGQVGRWNAEVLESGLLLDVLAFHATDLGTAAQVDPAALRAMYRHRLDVLDGLVGRCKDQYLLTDTEPVADGAGRPTRLAHDLLAPLVLQRFRLSVAPGQRARRLLENRVPEWADGKSGSVLDRADLSGVLHGATGMRARTPDEDRLVEASRAEDQRLRDEEAEEARRLREAEEGRLKAEALARQEAEARLAEQQQANTRLRQGAMALAVTLALTLVAAWFARVEKRDADAQRDVASNNLTKFLNEASQRALAEVEQLRSAEPQAVPEILGQVRANAVAMQRVRAMRTNPASLVEVKCRTALALLPEDPSQAEFLLGQAIEPGIHPDELLLIRQFVVPYLTAERAAALWPVVQSAKTRPDARLRHAAVLAALDPRDERWSKEGPKIVADVLAANPLQLGSWIDALREVREALVPALVTRFKGGEPNQRTVAATILSNYAADRTELLLELLKEADPAQFALLFKNARHHREEALRSMTGELDPAASTRAGEPAASRAVPARPASPGDYARLDATAGKRANALITLALLDQPEPLWQALKHSPDPRVRSYLIVRMGPMGVDFKLLTQRLLVEKDPSIRAALVLALGHFPYDVLVGEIRRQVGDRLLADYARDDNPGLHSAIAWLFANMGRPDCEQLDATLATTTPESGRPWFVNSQGQTFVAFREPVVFRMGSPPEEDALGRVENERQHSRRLPRPFAIATREVTGREFLKFLDSPDAKDVAYLRDNLRDYSHDRDRGPIVGVTWFEAVQYCRWLSELEGIPKSQMCYPPLAQIKEDMTLDPDFLSRGGYRLPTEAEWEYACRAGTETPWAFGSDRSLLPEFGWFLSNSIIKDRRGQAQTTGQKMPNALGIFDMHGNVYEWCGDRNPAYPAGDGPPVEDADTERPDRKVIDADIRIYRGGSFADLALNLRSAYRDSARPTNRFPAVGFRLVRTLSTK
jgi:formylglycine-generating enzyme required for sulfatase activity